MTRNSSNAATNRTTLAFLDNIFFHDLLPFNDPLGAAAYLHEIVLPTVLPPVIILPVEQYVFPAPVNVRQANPRLDMRGRGNRQKRPKKDPYASIFFLKYIQEADESTLLDNTTDTIWDASSYDGKTFRRRFGIPYKIFHSINKDWLRHGEFRKEGDALGQERTDSRILLLGCFRFLAKGITFDAVEELSNVSLAYFHVFFKKFVDWFPKCYNKEWIVFPSDNVGVRHVEARYASRGLLLKCLGSLL